ncbi:MAG: hypothetical protein RLZZ303_3238 [Candidatus Hydrogenedentota bacterium]|jgi:hypothetical protein
MPLYQVTSNSLLPITRTSFDLAGLLERADLQRLLREQIEIVAPNCMVIAEEFGDWEDSRRRIDLLLLDKDANLVICELKRSEDGGHLELQAIRYAAMVSTMTFRQCVEAHSAFLRKHQLQDNAEELILSFLEWDEPDDERFATSVRIVLVSQNFSKEITSSVLWLNNFGLDIRCVRIIPHTFSNQTILDVQYVIPLPEAQEYQVQIRQKEQSVREARDNKSSTQSNERHIRFWGALLSKAQARHDLHARISPSKENWIAATVSGLYFAYVIARNQGRVELYFPGSSAEENKRVFKNLHAKRIEIEKSFGDELDWQPLENKQACRIAYIAGNGNSRDEESWESLHEAMVDAMIRLEKAFMPHIPSAIAK